MKHLVKVIPLLMSLIFISCNEDLESVPEPEPIAFERVRNLVGARGNVGNLAIFHNRLYYSNNANPGYFTADGEHVQFGIRNYNMEMGQVLSEDFTIAVYRDLRFFEFIPTVNYASNYKNPLRVDYIEGLPETALINPGWFMSPSFGINGNHFLASFDHKWGSGNAMILELNFKSSYNKHLAAAPFDPPILRQININAQIDGRGITQLISVFPYQEGWVASANISGYHNSFYITKEGNAKRIPDESSNERFIIISFQETEQGELFVSSESGIHYSPSGNLEDLSLIAAANVNTVRLRFVGERMLMFIGTDQIFEVTDYRDPETIALHELQNLGLADLLVRDIIEYGGKVWVATNAGLFTKSYDYFWERKEVPQEQQSHLFEVVN